MESRKSPITGGWWSHNPRLIRSQHHTPVPLSIFSTSTTLWKHTKSIKQLLNMAIEIYSWFTHQKLWLSIDFVCLPEGNPEITMKCDEALVWSCLPIVILPGNAIPDDVPDDFSWLIPRGWYMGGSRHGDIPIAGWFLMENPIKMDDAHIIFSILSLLLDNHGIVTNGYLPQLWTWASSGPFISRAVCWINAFKPQ